MSKPYYDANQKNRGFECLNEENSCLVFVVMWGSETIGVHIITLKKAIQTWNPRFGALHQLMAFCRFPLCYPIWGKRGECKLP